MAYLTPIIPPKCAQPNCLRPANQTLMRWDNEPLSSYCSSHAESALIRQRESEERAR